MPQVYSVEEANRLFADIKELLHKADTEQAINIADIKARVDAKFNELFGLYHTCNNKLDLLDARLAEEQKNEDTQKRLVRVMQK
jgi:hypothetical protein